MSRVNSISPVFRNTPGWHMNKKYWISVYFNQDVPDNKIKELIKQSYDIVYQSLPKKEKGM